VEHLAEEYQMPHRETDKEIHDLKSRFGRGHRKFTESKRTGRSPPKKGAIGSVTVH